MQFQKHPAILPNVSVKSSVEISLQKQMEKDLKKEKRKVNKNSEFELDESRAKFDENLALMKDLSRRPLFKREFFEVPYIEEYQKLPFVWDDLAEATQTVSYLTTNKLSLPENCKRTNNKYYEEIVIPAEKRDGDFLNRKIPLETLDYICQVAFQGVKSLNIVQSIVYDSAYNTAENLLVCAPTGSGKTNVALLAILHLIKKYSEENGILELPQNIEGGETGLQDLKSRLRKDEFKVIYVAPMKALASEMVQNFGKKLAPFGLSVRELTGDMQLTKREIMETQMIVTTPEKWDVITRKNTGDVALVQLVKLLIIDEVHLLQDNRGPVIEAIVARTLRQVETMQNMIRIVGLSATLPSYLDVAKFLRVNPRKGLFFFDGRFRPVPLIQTFIGVKTVNHNLFEQRREMDQICYEEIIKKLLKGKQVMVFVHARNATVKTALALRESASRQNKLKLFTSPLLQIHSADSENLDEGDYNQRLKELIGLGFGFHHAGLLRSDRNTVEKYFANGCIRCLVCTATLAWGVNLPAHCVLIKGTDIYDAQAGGFRDLSILDVTQIFGRAGRPQFYKAAPSTTNTLKKDEAPSSSLIEEDQSFKKIQEEEAQHSPPTAAIKEYNGSFGEAILLTTHDRFAHYITAFVRRMPIESKFADCLYDNLNAEIVLGTVSNVTEAVEWLAYTYLHIRLKANPLAYGISYEKLRLDPNLSEYENDLIRNAARRLDKARMIRYDEKNGYFYSTDMGRVASHFYVNCETIELFNQRLQPNVTEAKVLSLVSRSSEFGQIKLREEEVDELTDLAAQCPLPVYVNEESGPQQLSPFTGASKLLNSTHLLNISGVPPSSSTASSDTGIEGASEAAKTNVLIQAYISRDKINSFSLISDSNYISQNITRIIRALFEIVIKKGWPIAAGRLLNFAKIVDTRCWSFESPLKQFDALSQDILDKLEQKRLTIDKLRDMDANEIGHMVHNTKAGMTIKSLAQNFPLLQLDAVIQPITRSILRIKIDVLPDFVWNDKFHGTSENWWIWVEDPENNHIYHSEYLIMTKKQIIMANKKKRAMEKRDEDGGDVLEETGNIKKYRFTYKSEKESENTIIFTIPIFEPLPTQYYIRAISDRWVGSENVFPLSFQKLILPEHHPPQTDLLDLTPLPVMALNNSHLELLYKFTHFNPVQTQVFHCMYHTDYNALVGAPTGSGKTIMAELAIFRLWREYPGHKAVYIAPLKALVKERIKDWSVRFENLLRRNVNGHQNLDDLSAAGHTNKNGGSNGKLIRNDDFSQDKIRIVELTGDHAPDIRSIAAADLIITTPEKWDGISRNWQTRNYVKLVNLIVIDEIHMLGSTRGPVLEAIVSRTNYIASHTHMPVRIIGLSTALANPNDLANWLGIDKVGLYNFRPSVRPVPLEAHISGFPGKHYCPRMATMNKPAFQAIKTYSSDKPTIIFVSSRRQTRLTALDLIAYLALEDNPKQWLRLTDDEAENIASTVKDANLAHFLLFGIGMHHAGLHERDRKIVEELFVNQKILVLIATSTLAWGVNYPAHLVVIKGTEYFDGKLHKYVDFPITDVLQMMGRAGRPQYDDEGVAVILVQDTKKQFYKKFLYEPFPVESNLLEVLPDHINAEIVAGTITNKQEALDYLTWTYFFRRLWKNPSYYGLEDIDQENTSSYLSYLIEKTTMELEQSYCIDVDPEDQRTISATNYGRIASFYYLSHRSIKIFRDKLGANLNLETLLNVVSSASEYDELPVRHNEDSLNADLSDIVPFKVDQYTFDSPHTKANLLLQCYFSRCKMPSSDYYTDTKTLLDQIFRILQALLDMAAEEGWLMTSISLVNFMQMCSQARWFYQSPLLMLPHVYESHLTLFNNVEYKHNVRFNIVNIPQLVRFVNDERVNLRKIFPSTTDNHFFTNQKIDDIFNALVQFPMIRHELQIIDNSSGQKIEIDLTTRKRRKVEDWPSLFINREYLINLSFKRLNKTRKRGSKAFCPKFPKDKDESWIIILGDTERKELIALKRIGCVYNFNRSSISFVTPEMPGSIIYTLYIMNDCYLGLDQQYDLCFNVIE